MSFWFSFSSFISRTKRFSKSPYFRTHTHIILATYASQKSDANVAEMHDRMQIYCFFIAFICSCVFLFVVVVVVADVVVVACDFICSSFVCELETMQQRYVECLCALRGTTGKIFLWLDSVTTSSFCIFCRCFFFALEIYCVDSHFENVAIDQCSSTNKSTYKYAQFPEHRLFVSCKFQPTHFKCLLCIQFI